MHDLIRYFSENAATLGRQTLEHLGLTALSVLLAVVAGVPLGVACVRHRGPAGWCWAWPACCKPCRALPCWAS
jgi:osmoprotectant transport system permease protein